MVNFEYQKIFRLFKISTCPESIFKTAFLSYDFTQDGESIHLIDTQMVIKSAHISPHIFHHLFFLATILVSVDLAIDWTGVGELPSLTFYDMRNLENRKFFDVKYLLFCMKFNETTFIYNFSRYGSIEIISNYFITFSNASFVPPLIFCSYEYVKNLKGHVVCGVSVI